MKRLTFTSMVLLAGVCAAFVAPAVAQHEHPAGDPGRDVTLLNQSFGEAQVQRDVAKLDRLLADDFTLINPAGKTLNKAQFLADMSSGELRYESLNYDDVELRVYRDVALATGRVVRKGQYKGQDNSGQFRFIHVFVRHQGHWQISIAQATRISQ